MPRKATKKTTKKKVVKPCDMCGATGLADPNNMCENCDGSGTVS